MRRLAAARKDLLPLRTGGESTILGVDNGAIFSLAPPAPPQRQLRRRGALT
jgi:hypothetical protein